MKRHPELQQYLKAHPGVQQQLKQNPQVFMKSTQPSSISPTAPATPQVGVPTAPKSPSGIEPVPKQ